MAGRFTDPRQAEHIANLGKPLRKPEAPKAPKESVVDVEAVPVKPKIIATGGKK